MQPLVGPTQRYLTKVDLSFDGGAPITVDLTDASRTADGQTVHLPVAHVPRGSTSPSPTPTSGDESTQPYSNSVGFAEIRLRDDAPGAHGRARRRDRAHAHRPRRPRSVPRAADRPLVYQMSRAAHRRGPAALLAGRGRAGASLHRARRPHVRRAAAPRASPPTRPTPRSTRVLGIPGRDAGGITVTSSQHLPGDIASRGSSAFDGDPATAWSTAFGAPVGQWVDVTTPQPVTFDHLDLQVVADGKHSVPTQLRIDAGGESRTVDRARDHRRQGRRTRRSRSRCSSRRSPGTDVRITVTGVRAVDTLDYHERTAERDAGRPRRGRDPRRAARAACRRRSRAPAAPTSSPSTVSRVGVQLSGTDRRRRRGQARRPAAVPGERRPPPGSTLDRGDHLGALGRRAQDTGIDVDGLVLGSDAGGAAMALGRPRRAARVGHATPSGARGDAAGEGHEQGQHQDRAVGHRRAAGARRSGWCWARATTPGWEASVAGKNVGGSTLVDGYANGWLVHPTAGTFSVTLRVDAAAHGVDRARGVGARVPGVPVLALCVAAGGGDGHDDDVHRRRPRRRVRQPVRRGGHRPAAARSWWARSRSAWWARCSRRGGSGCLPRRSSRWSRTSPRSASWSRWARRWRSRRARAVRGRAAVPVRLPGRPRLAGQFDGINDLAWLAVILLLADVVVEALRDDGRSASARPIAA